MRAFNSTLSSNMRRGRLREVNMGRDGRDATHKTNQTLLLSVMVSLGCNLRLLHSHYEVMTAETQDMIIMILNTCFVLMYIHTLLLLTYRYRTCLASFHIAAAVLLRPSMSPAISMAGVERKKQQSQRGPL